MRSVFLVIGICIFSFAQAQKNIQYTGSAEGDLLLVHKPYSSFFSLTQGIAYKGFSAGIGAGYDFYRMHSIPVFMDVKKTFTNKKIQPFAQLAAGINIEDVTKGEKNFFYPYYEGHFDNGFFAKAGGGIVLNAQKKVKVYLSAGYTYKSVSFTYENVIDPRYPIQTYNVKDYYHLNRWYAGAGISW